MLFSEIYGSYYDTVSRILRRAVEGELTDREMRSIVAEHAFSESIAVIPDALKSGRWPLLNKDGTTPLHRSPTAPLSLLQKRWLKALLLDPRIALFSPSQEGLEDVSPLYTPDMLVYFDQYSDGDPYSDPAYIQHFHTLLAALRERRKVRVRFTSRAEKRLSWVCVPLRLEYSEKDDKFRLLAVSGQKPLTINLAQIRALSLLEPYTREEAQPPQPKKQELVLELTDLRNALERVLLHFSHLEKETERLDGSRYRITLRYDQEDETELLIRVLSFGPVIRAVSPPAFVELIRQRLSRQAALSAAGADGGDGVRKTATGYSS